MPRNDESRLAESPDTILPVVSGGGVVANVLLSQSKAQKGCWIVITAGRACGVTFAVYDVNALNGALEPCRHQRDREPAISSARPCPPYILAQAAGSLPAAG